MTDETTDLLVTMFGNLEGALMDRYLHIPPSDPKNTIDTNGKFSVSNNPDKDSTDTMTTQAPRQVDQSTRIGHGSLQIAQKTIFQNGQDRNNNNNNTEETESQVIQIQELSTNDRKLSTNCKGKCYHCETCNKYFIRKDQYQRHITIHTKELFT